MQIFYSLFSITIPSRAATHNLTGSFVDVSFDASFFAYFFLSSHKKKRPFTVIL